MNKITFDFYDDLDEETKDRLRQQRVDVDDWDYMLFFKCQHTVDLPLDWHPRRAYPENENIVRLLRGHCSNVWYVVDDFRGEKGILGVAYHG